MLPGWTPVALQRGNFSISDGYATSVDRRKEDNTWYSRHGRSTNTPNKKAGNKALKPASPRQIAQ